MSTERARRPLRLQRRLVFALVVAVAAAAVVVAMSVARRDASQRADDLATQAANVSGNVVSGLVSGLGGAPVLVQRDGSISVDAFDAYAQDVVQQSPAQALALVSIVRDEDREEFERTIGRPIVDQIGGQPAARRPVYYVVRRVTPATDASRSLIGVDFGMDPIRSDALSRALGTGATVISGPIRAQPSGAPAFFVARPLYRTNEADTARSEPVALVTTAFLGTRLLDDIAAQLPPGTPLEVSDGDGVLAVTDPPPEGGHVADLNVLDRRWQVRVEDQEGVGYGIAWLVGLVAVGVVGAVGLVLARGARYERRLRAGTEAMGRLADLSRDLAGAVDVDDLALAVSTHVPSILDAQLAGIAVVEPEEDRVRMIRRPEIPPPLVDAFAEIPLTAGSPVAAAAHRGEPVLLRDAAALRRAMLPGEAGALAAAGYEAVALLPLQVRGSVAVIVGVAWRSSQQLGHGEEARLRNVSEVCTRTLERIESARITVGRETGLATLARRLSKASSAADVGRAVFEEAGEVAGAIYANLGFVDPLRAELVIQVPSRLPDEVAQRYQRLPLDAATPLTDAVVRDETVWLTDEADMAARYPAIVDDARRVGFGSLVALPLRGSLGKPRGALGLAWRDPVTADAALRSTLDITADMTAQTFERVELVDEHLREGELNRRLAHVAERLAMAGSTDEVLSILAGESAVAVAAASAAVGVVDDARGVIHLVDSATGEGRTVAVDAPDDLVARVIRSRSDVLGESDVHGAPRTLAATLPDHRRNPIGVLTVTFPTEHTIALEDTAAVKRLADLAGQALERAVVADGDRRRTRLLATFATDLSAARRLDEVIEVVIRSGGRAVDADDVVVGLVDDTRDMAVMHGRAVDTESVDSTERSLTGDLDPARDAIVRRERILVADADEWAERYPGSAPGALEHGIRATAALPLRWAEGGRLGVVSVAWRRAVTFDDQTLTTLHLIARLSAQALQRAALHEIEHRVVADLQQRLVSEMPVTPGLLVAARYRAAGRGPEMGGDWFAGLPLDAGRLGLIVGDMSGHGISAVADMAQVRAMTSALLRAGLDLEDVAEEASAFVAESASAVATAVIAIVDPAAAQLSCVIAGQVPPLLVAADGSVEVLDDLRRPLLGVPRRSDRRIVVRRRFEPGALFVAYTDGLIERRGEIIDEGIARLRRAVRDGFSEPPDALADRLLSGLLGRPTSDVEDDVALVIVRAAVQPPGPGDEPASSRIASAVSRVAEQ